MTGQVGQLGKNSAEEFFETIIMMVGYEETKKIIHEFTKEIDNPILKEAIEDSMNVLAMGLIMTAIRTQEALIAKIFEYAESILIILIAKSRNVLSKLKGLRGTKLFRKMKFLQGSNQDDLMTAQIIATHQGFKGNAQSLGQRNHNASSYDTFQMSNTAKNSLYNREQLHMNMGNNMASRYNETLLFKLFTKSFTKNDELLLKKILGRESASVLNVEDVNQVADFMFVKDSTGKPIGLTEAFYELINGLGYLHNK